MFFKAIQHAAIGTIKKFFKFSQYVISTLWLGQTLPAIMRRNTSPLMMKLLTRPKPKSLSSLLFIAFLSTAWPALSKPFQLGNHVQLGPYKNYKVGDGWNKSIRSKEFDSCLKTFDGQTVAGMHKCYDIEMHRLEGILNLMYHLALKDIPPARVKLKLAERSWIATRDDACVREENDTYRDSAGKFTGGTDAAFELADCKMNETKRRVDWLGELDLKNFTTALNEK